MQLKITVFLLLFTSGITTLRGKALHPKGCYECEEEVWEEIPCNDIPSNSTTPYYYPTSTYKPITSRPKTTTPKPYTKPSTTAYPSTSKPYPTTAKPVYTTTPDPYKKCYCECKIGCKEFCRKVVINSPDQQIVQVSKISQPVEKGRLESTHFLQRELIPNHNDNYDNNYASSYDNDEADNDHYPQYEATTFPPKHLPRLPSYPTYNNEPKPSSHNPYVKPIEPPIQPKYYATAEAGANSLHSFASYPSIPTLYQHNNPPSFESQNFPIPLEIPVKSSQLQTSLDFDDSLESLIKEFMSNDHSNQRSHKNPSKPFYSVSYSR